MKTCRSNDTGLEAATSASPVTDELVDISVLRDPQLTEPALCGVLPSQFAQSVERLRGNEDSSGYFEHRHVTECYPFVVKPAHLNQQQCIAVFYLPTCPRCVAHWQQSTSFHATEGAGTAPRPTDVSAIALPMHMFHNFSQIQRYFHHVSSLGEQRIFNCQISATQTLN